MREEGGVIVRAWPGVRLMTIGKTDKKVHRKEVEQTLKKREPVKQIK